MSEMRKQLERAREEYLAVRYPGDLAGEVLGRNTLSYAMPQRRRWPFYAGVGALGAIAASIGLLMFTLQSHVAVTPTADPPLTFEQPRNPDEFSVVPQLAGGTLVPRDVRVVPSGMPAFPSLSEMMNTTDSLTDSDSKENS